MDEVTQVTESQEIPNETTSTDSGVADEIALQERQIGDDVGFDDGIGFVVDEHGNPVFDKNGNAFKSIEEYRKAQSATPQVQKPTQVNGQQQMQPNAPKQQVKSGFDSFFSKDDSFDFDRLGQRVTKAHDVQYRSGLFPKVDPNAQSVQPEPVKTPRQEVEEFQQEQTNIHLAPLQKLYAEIAAGLTPEQDAKFREIYNEKLAEVNKAIENKRWEAMEKMTQSAKQEEANKLLEEKSNTSISKAVVELLPQEGMNGFWNLVVGHQEGNKFVRGPGADIVDMLFDQAHEGKQFKTADEWNKAYQTWFQKYTSNESNVKSLIRISLNAYAAKNMSKYRDLVRSTVQREEQQKKTLLSPKPKTGLAPSGEPQGDNELSAYLKSKPISRI